MIMSDFWSKVLLTVDRRKGRYIELDEIDRPTILVGAGPIGALGMLLLDV